MDPKRFETSIGSGYAMEVDVIRDDCRREPAHWHLTKNGRRIGQIWVDSCRWASTPDAPRWVIDEAESKTSSYSSEIKEVYRYNAEYGARW